MVITKREDETKQGFWKILRRKPPLSGKPLISAYSDSISISLSLKSISDLKFLGAASSMPDIVTWANG